MRISIFNGNDLDVCSYVDVFQIKNKLKFIDSIFENIHTVISRSCVKVSYTPKLHHLSFIETEDFILSFLRCTSDILSIIKIYHLKISNDLLIERLKSFI